MAFKGILKTITVQIFGGIRMKAVFSENIGKIMYQKGMTQEDLAKQSGLTRQTVNKVLGLSRKNNEDMSLETAISISRALDYNFPDLFSRNFDPNKVSIYKEDNYLIIFTGNVKRIIKGKKQKLLSTSPGIQESTISDILNENITNPKMSSLVSIANSIEKDLSILFTRGGHEDDI